MTTSDDNPEFHADPVLDACLDELLGGISPPELSAQILSRLEDKNGNSRQHPDDSLASFSENLRPRINTQSSADRRTSRHGSKSLIPGWTVTSLVCVVGLIAMVAMLSTFKPQPELTPIVESSSGNADTSQSTTDNSVGPISTPPREEPGEPPTQTNRPTTPSSLDPAQAKPSPPSVESRLASLTDEEMIANIDQQLQRHWSLAGVTPTNAVSDQVWCDRVYRQLIGRPPHSREAANFFKNQAEDKREQLVDELLGPNHAEAFADFWSTQWSNWLLSQPMVRPKERRVFRVGLAKYFSDALMQRQAFDETYAHLLSATGSNDPNRDDFDAATNFWLAMLDSDRIDITAQICRQMMGQRIRCAQCHDDQQNRIPQKRFWQVSAVFRNVDTERFRVGRGRVTDHASTQKVQYESPEGNWHDAQPAAVDGTRFEEGTNTTLRRQFADWVVGSVAFRRASINRVWANLLRYGFTFPIDDLGPHHPVSHPELVESLSTQFAAANFDFRRLVKWVVLSKAFDRTSVITAGNAKDFPDGGSVALFTRFYERPSIFGSAVEGLMWLASGETPQVTNSLDIANQSLIQGLRRETEASDGASKMGQLLPMSHLRIASSLANRQLPPAQLLNHAFLVTLDRMPTDEERQRADTIFRSANGNQAVALERIFWALLNRQ